MTNVCISNVPGPQVPVYMNGAAVVKQMAMGPLSDRMGLFIAVTSYNGNIAFNATSCRRTMPDVDFFIQCINESFTELKAAAVAKNKIEAKKKVAKRKVGKTPKRKVNPKTKTAKKTKKKSTRTSTKK